MMIMASGPITLWQRDGETMEIVTEFIFLGSKITENGDPAMKLKDPAPWKKSYDQPRQNIKKQRQTWKCLGTHVRIKDFKIKKIKKF